MSQASAEPETLKEVGQMCSNSHATEIYRGAKPKRKVKQTVSKASAPATENLSEENLTIGDINRIRELLNLPEPSPKEIKMDAFMSRYFISREDLDTAALVCIEGLKKSDNLFHTLTFYMELNSIAERLKLDNALKICIQDFIDYLDYCFEKLRERYQFDCLENLENLCKALLNNDKPNAYNCREFLKKDDRVDYVFEICMYGLIISNDLFSKFGIYIELKNIVEHSKFGHQNVNSWRATSFLWDVEKIIHLLTQCMYFENLCSHLDTIKSKKTIHLEFGCMFYGWAKEKGYVESFLDFYFVGIRSFDVLNQIDEFDKEMLRILSSECPTDRNILLKVRRELGIDQKKRGNEGYPKSDDLCLGFEKLFSLKGNKSSKKKNSKSKSKCKKLFRKIVSIFP